MNFILKNIKFFKDVATLMTGTVFSQLIAALAYPVFSRLYSPTEMGFFAFFSGTCAMLLILFTCRYELAIILPKLDKEADNTAALSLLYAAMGCIISLLIIFAFQPYILGLGKNDQLVDWIYCIPILTFLMSFSQIMDYVGIRYRVYQKLAVKSVFLQVIYVSSAILLGVWACTNNGLIMGRIFSFVGVSIILVWIFFYRIQMIVKNMSLKLMWGNIFCYKQFLFCNVPYSFLGTFSKESIIFIFVMFGYSESAGCFALAKSVLCAPISFLSSTLGPVFYKESVITKGTQKLEQLILQLINLIVIFGVPGVVFFVIWAHEIFSFCFGEVWREAGTYAAIYMPSAFLYLFTGWSNRLYEVHQKQYVSLKIQIIFDFFSIASLWSFMKFGVDTEICVLFYTIINCIYQITYLSKIFKISNFDLRKLLDSGRKILILTFLSIILLYFPCHVFTSLFAQFIGGVFLLMGYYSFIIYHNVRPLGYSTLKFLSVG